MSLQYNIFAITLALAAVLNLGMGIEIEVPAIVDNNPFMVKLGATKVIAQPDFDFQKIYKREVLQADGISTYRFAPCDQHKAQVQFTPLDQIVFEGIPKRPVVYYNFEDIRYSQFLLDIYYQNLVIYIMFKNHLAAIVKLESDSSIESVKLIKIEGTNFNNGQYLEIGYFIKVQSDILFVNNNYTIKITNQSATAVQGYPVLSDFSSVVAIRDGLFAVVQTSKGITVLKYDGNKIQKKKQFSSSDLATLHNELRNNSETQGFPELRIMDIVYWKEKQILFVLDEVTGVQSYKLTTEGDTVSLVEQQSITSSRECTLMYLYSTNLYVYCGRVRLFKLEKWPVNQQLALPYPNVEVKQIYQYQNLVAFVGKNSFALMYLDKMVNYFEDANMDKLLIYNDFYISADQEGVDIGRINIIDTYVSCSTTNEDFLGTTNLMFKTTAECNSTYFEKFKVDTTKLGEINSQDRCVYTVYKPITIWKVGEIKTFPFFIALIVIVVAVLLAVGVYLFRKMELNRYMQVIAELSKTDISASAQHQKLAEQLDGDVDNSKQTKKQEPSKESEVELGNVDNHEI